MSAIFLGRSFKSTERAHPCFVTDKRKRSGTWKDWGLIGGNIAVIITFLRSYEFPVHRITYFKLDHFLLQYWHSWRTAGWIRLNYLTHRCISFKKCIWKKTCLVDSKSRGFLSMSSSGHKCRPIRTVQGYPSHVTSGIFRTHLIRHTLVRTKVCTPLLSPEDVQISVVQTSVFSYYRNLIFRYSMALTVYFHLLPWPFSSAFGLHLVWTKGVRASRGRVALGTTHQMSEFRWIFRTHTSL